MGSGRVGECGGSSRHGQACMHQLAGSSLHQLAQHGTLRKWCTIVSSVSGAKLTRRRSFLLGFLRCCFLAGDGSAFTPAARFLAACSVGEERARWAGRSAEAAAPRRRWQRQWRALLAGAPCRPRAPSRRRGSPWRERAWRPAARSCPNELGAVAQLPAAIRQACRSRSHCVEAGGLWGRQGSAGIGKKTGEWTWQ